MGSERAVPAVAFHMQQLRSRWLVTGQKARIWGLPAAVICWACHMDFDICSISLTDRAKAPVCSYIINCNSTTDWLAEQNLGGLRITGCCLCFEPLVAASQPSCCLRCLKRASTVDLYPMLQGSQPISIQSPAQRVVRFARSFALQHYPAPSCHLSCGASSPFTGGHAAKQISVAARVVPLAKGRAEAARKPTSSFRLPAQRLQPSSESPPLATVQMMVQSILAVSTGAVARVSISAERAYQLVGSSRNVQEIEQYGVRDS